MKRIYENNENRIPEGKGLREQIKEGYTFKYEKFTLEYLEEALAAMSGDTILHKSKIIKRINKENEKA